VVRTILEAYYDPQFSDHSHGFRPERGCHTALREIYYKWPATTWFIEGDISQCFDKLSHELLIKTLEEQIHDGRFINLIRGLLDAGYMEDWTLNQTLSGVPQGGIISPILSNILLDKLDKFVETILIPKYTRGKEKRDNPVYRKLVHDSFEQRRRGNVEKAEELRKQFQQLPSKDAQDPEFRRLRYVRYADDFLLGFIGPKSEAEEIKQQLEEFLRDELTLELSKTKTLITHAKSEAAKFLGYEITILHENNRRTTRRDTGTKRRSINGKIGLKVPKSVIKEKCERYKKKGRSTHRTELIDESDYYIITLYQLEYRGLVNYYRLAYNMTELTNVRWVMERSLTQTLALKHKMTAPQVYEKYAVKTKVDGKVKTVLQATVPRKDKEPLVARWSNPSLKWDIKATLEDKPPTVYGNVQNSNKGY
jgi:group II intron reverse transcriptase/maturase